MVDSFTMGAKARRTQPVAAQAAALSLSLRGISGRHVGTVLAGRSSFAGPKSAQVVVGPGSAGGDGEMVGGRVSESE